MKLNQLDWHSVGNYVKNDIMGGDVAYPVKNKKGDLIGWAENSPTICAENPQNDNAHEIEVIKVA